MAKGLWPILQKKNSPLLTLPVQPPDLILHSSLNTVAHPITSTVGAWLAPGACASHWDWLNPSSWSWSGRAESWGYTRDAFGLVQCIHWGISWRAATDFRVNTQKWYCVTMHLYSVVFLIVYYNMAYKPAVNKVEAIKLDWLIDASPFLGSIAQTILIVEAHKV